MTSETIGATKEAVSRQPNDQLAVVEQVVVTYQQNVLRIRFAKIIYTCVCQDIMMCILILEVGEIIVSTVLWRMAVGYDIFLQPRDSELSWRCYGDPW